MSRVSLEVAKNKIDQCIQSCTDESQMLSCVRMIDNLDVYIEANDIKNLSVFQTKIVLGFKAQHKIISLCQTTPKSQE